MDDNKITITKYSTSDRAETLRLLLELQSKYFQQNASKQLQELDQEIDIRKSYEDYLNLIEDNENDTWLTLLAKTNTKKVVGFIIGSVQTDESLILNKIGNFEDWFVEPQFREQGIGLKLYNELENWFKEKGCKQIYSDTWEGNQLSIEAHKQAGFFISGIQFKKKL